MKPKIKKCLYCGKEFEDNTFNGNKKYCSTLCRRIYYQTTLDKEYHKKRAMKYREGIKKNPELYKKELKKRRGFEKLPKYRYRSVKSTAKRRKYNFNLTFQEYVDNFYHQPCYYCGGKTQDGIDRYDNTKGYELDNCVPCCKVCNRAKSDLLISDFFSQIQKIYNKHTLEINSLVLDA